MRIVAALAALLLLPRAAQGAEGASCAVIRGLAGSLKPEWKPSTPNPINCFFRGGESSNYVLPTQPSASAEVHIISVREGRFGGEEAAKARGATGSVRVVLHKTRKPAILVLNAQKPTRWELTVTQEAELRMIILQGRGEQALKGAPSGIPVQRRAAEQACAFAEQWEAFAQADPRAAAARGKLNSDFRAMAQGIRCLTGLREASFQGCGLGLVFEVPHYHPDAKGLDADEIAPVCPGGLSSPETSAAAPQASESPEGAAVQARAPEGPKSPKREGPEAEIENKTQKPKKPQETLSSSPGIPMRDYISVRAEAILMKGDRTLLTHDAVPDLVLVLERGDARLRSRAADALGQLGAEGADAVAALMRTLAKDESPRARSSAALALGNIGPAAKEAVPLLKRAAKSRNPDLRLSAKTALERLGAD
ncbi:MAG: HEAT repeat domain-containing protein [Elusimicrobia bacterium]|nr:HEAT repeat domain-containing protein [Elusimicrobiota bacterium]